MFCLTDSYSPKKFHESIACARSNRGFFTRPRATLGKPAPQNAYQFSLPRLAKLAALRHRRLVRLHAGTVQQLPARQRGGRPPPGRSAPGTGRDQDVRIDFRGTFRCRRSGRVALPSGCVGLYLTAHCLRLDRSAETSRQIRLPPVQFGGLQHVLVDHIAGHSAVLNIEGGLDAQFTAEAQHLVGGPQ
jgi:hypothetical protein